MANPKFTIEMARAVGYKAISPQRTLGNHLHELEKKSDLYIRTLQIFWKRIKGFLLHKPPFIVDYKKAYKTIVLDSDTDDYVIPSIVPQWDHTPRSGWNGTLLVNSTPEYFYKLSKRAIEIVRFKKNPIIFLKSWNEWGEGNMMEPDITYGRGFIEALRKAINDSQIKSINNE